MWICVVLIFIGLKAQHKNINMLNWQICLKFSKMQLKINK